MQKISKLITKKIDDNIRYSEGIYPDIVKNLPYVTKLNPTRLNWYDHRTFYPIPIMQTSIDQLITPIRIACNSIQ